MNHFSLLLKNQFVTISGGNLFQPYCCWFQRRLFGVKITQISLLFMQEQLIKNELQGTPESSIVLSIGNI